MKSFPSLTFVLDAPQPSYELGEPILGHIVVVVDEPCDCDELNIVLECRAQRRAAAATGEQRGPWVLRRRAFSLHSGPWAPGRYEYPVRRAATGGPVSYRGVYFVVEWFLRADLRVGNQRETSEETRVVLTGGADVTEPAFPTAPSESTPWYLSSASNALALGICVALLASGFFAISVATSDGVFLRRFGLTVGLLFSVYSVACLRRAWTSFAFGAIRVRFERSWARPGEDLPFHVVLLPRRAARVGLVTASLIGEERCRTGYVDHAGDWTETELLTELHSAGVTVAPFVRVRAGEPVELSAAIRIPPDAAPSFGSYKNGVHWSISVHVETSGDVLEEGPFEISVQPGRTKAAPGLDSASDSDRARGEAARERESQTGTRLTPVGHSHPGATPGVDLRQPPAHLKVFGSEGKRQVVLTCRVARYTFAEQGDDLRVAWGWFAKSREIGTYAKSEIEDVLVLPVRDSAGQPQYKLTIVPKSAQRASRLDVAWGGAPELLWLRAAVLALVRGEGLPGPDRPAPRQYGGCLRGCGCAVMFVVVWLVLGKLAEALPAALSLLGLG